MKTIIEKFGIEPIESIDGVNLCGGDWCDEDQVRKLEQQRNELLEALIEFYNNERHPNILDIIVKADPLKRSMEEIRELIK